MPDIDRAMKEFWTFYGKWRFFGKARESAVYISGKLPRPCVPDFHDDNNDELQFSILLKASWYTVTYLELPDLPG